MLSMTEWLDWVERNRQRVRKYQLGMDGTDGLCDCIGLIIGAVRLSGNKWSGTHGSNYAARNRVKAITSTQDSIVLGELVFKAHEPGESGYALPATYANHPDRRDYYHVGVVTSVTPLRITHCTSCDGGIKVDTKLGQWKYGGELDIVSNEEGRDATMKTARVIIPEGRTGTTVNVRKRPDLSSPVICTVPHGTEIKAADAVDGWCQVDCDGATGYMMSQFLQLEETEQPAEDKLAAIKAKAKELIAAIEGAGLA